MVHVIADRVADTSITTGTGNFSVSGSAPTNFETLGTVLATNDTFDYLIVHQSLGEWEQGIGTYQGSNAFARTTVKQSSNSDAAVSFSAGTKDVFLVHSADRIKNPKLVASINDGPLAGLRNAVINGAMMVAQRGTSFTSTGSANNDDTYNLDRWTLLSSGNNIVNVSQETSVVPTGGLNALALTVVTTNQKFGVIQFIEQKDCIGLIGNTVTLSFKMKVSATTNLDNVKAAILSWDGTADTVTSDVVSAWGSEGTNPTLVSNWTYENTPTNLSPTTSYATYSITAAVDTASTKNIAVFIWSDVTVTTATSDVLYITDVQLELGATATSFERRPYAHELATSQRYFQVVNRSNAGRAESTTQFNAMSILPCTLRANPTVTLVGTIKARDLNAGVTKTATSPSLNSSTADVNSIYFEINASSWAAANFSAGDICFLLCDAGSNGLLLSAEL